MFTGIITEIGKVNNRIGSKLSITADQSVNPVRGYSSELTSERTTDDFGQSASNGVKELKIGDSISVNGVCLTVVEKYQTKFKVDLLSETLTKTNLGKLNTGDPVNLELALKVGDRLGGHIVTGHIDCTGKLIRKYKKGNDTVLEIEIPLFFAKKIIQKGSIAINGVSLTVARLLRNKFTVHIIPHTLKNTNLIHCKIGQLLNIETDKYLKS